MATSASKRILVLDGCAFRGLRTLHTLEIMMKRVNKQHSTSARPCGVFDMICGSSVGGLIAILLGRLELSVEEAIEVYNDLASTFGNDEKALYNRLLSTDTLDFSKFDERLRNVIKKHANDENAKMIPQEDTGAKTFVTTTAGMPLYLNRTSVIRSYTAPKDAICLAPPKHEWSIFEAIKATISTPLYTTPFVVKGTHDFTDPSFSGFLNPLSLARQEAQYAWSASPFFIVSIGTSLVNLCPDPTTLSEAYQGQDKNVTPWCDRLLTKAGKPNVANKSKEHNRATYIARHLVLASSRAQWVHNNVIHNPMKNTTYYRLDPTSPPQEIEIFDYFNKGILDTVQTWSSSKETVTVFEKIADECAPYRTDKSDTDSDSLSELSHHSLANEYHSMAPPKPTEGTVNPGYNPVLDMPRPDTMERYLSDYHVLFIVDDSGSMKHDRRWPDTIDSLKVIAEHALQFHSKEVDIMFLNHKKRHNGVQGEVDVKKIFEGVAPMRGTPTGTVLRTILEQQIDALDEAERSDLYSAIKPLDVIVLTDGAPDSNDKYKPKDVIRDAVKRMKVSKHHPNSIGIQFVQIGNDRAAKKALKALMYGDNGYMVDTVAFNPEEPFNAAKLERIILGGVHPNVRAIAFESHPQRKNSTLSLVTNTIQKIKKAV